MTNQQIDNKLPPETDKFKDEIIEIDLVAIFRKIISFRKTIYKAIGIRFGYWHNYSNKYS